MFSFSKVFPYLTRALILLPGAISSAEQLGDALGRSSGADKKAAVLSTVQTELQAAEGIAGRDLANDAEVLAAAGAVIDAEVALHNLVAKKTAAPTA
jgi:hypothetical protein